jgi:hypothetical protein
MDTDLGQQSVRAHVNGPAKFNRRLECRRNVQKLLTAFLDIPRWGSKGGCLNLAAPLTEHMLGTVDPFRYIRPEHLKNTEELISKSLLFLVQPIRSCTFPWSIFQATSWGVLRTWE